MFSSRPAGTKRPASSFHFKNKRPRLDNNEHENRNKFGKGEPKRNFKSKDKFGGHKKDFKSKNKFDKGDKFDKGNKFNKGKGRKGGDKTNSHNRDHRPIGGKVGSKKFGKRKQMSKRK